jgi:hypothetical protein
MRSPLNRGGLSDEVHGAVDDRKVKGVFRVVDNVNNPAEAACWFQQE